MRYKLLFAMGVMLSCQPAFAAENWQFRLTPYAWFAGLKGDIASVPGSPSVPVDIPASDALKDTEASAMLVFEAQKGRHGFFTDLLYSDVRSKEDLIPAIGLTLKSTSKTTIFTLAYAYQIYDQGGASIDLLAGGRYWDIDTTLRFGGGSGLLAGKKVSHSESWLDPAIGIKGRASLGDSRFYLAGGAALGGFGPGSDSFYEITANIGYQWNKSIGTTIGYRLFDVNYEHNDFLYDVKQQGWQVGLTWAF